MSPDLHPPSLTAPSPDSPVEIPQSVSIAIVGDVHQQWGPADEAALQALAVDLVLFVGDFGNEDLAVVEQIAALGLPKAAICGNHDAWYTATPWGRRKRPYDPAVSDRFQAQLDALGAAHVGYGKLDFAQLGITVVGARPFSWGGSKWRNKTFYRDRYGIEGFADSTARIVAVARTATQPTVLVIGHNGPKGLGHQPEDICGKDWNPIGGDYGDPDLSAAIAQLEPELHRQGKSLPLVSFGHMHHRLRHRKDRLRTCLVQQGKTLYLNAARCPRLLDSPAGPLRNFSLVTLAGGAVTASQLVWLDASQRVVESEDLLAQAEIRAEPVPPGPKKGP